LEKCVNHAPPPRKWARRSEFPPAAAASDCRGGLFIYRLLAPAAFMPPAKVWLRRILISCIGCLDNPNWRGMRRSLMETFDKIYGLALRGKTKITEVAPNGCKDENSVVPKLAVACHEVT